MRNAALFAASLLAAVSVSVVAQATTITTYVTEVDESGNHLGVSTPGLNNSVYGLNAYTAVDPNIPQLVSSAVAGRNYPGGPIVVASGTAFGQMDYAVTFSGAGAGSLSGTIVPLRITYSGYTEVNGDSQAIAQLTVYDAFSSVFFDGANCTGDDPSQCGAFGSTATPFSFHVGSSDGYVELMTQVQANASSFYGPGYGSAYAFIDPVITLDPDFAKDHPGLVVTATAIDNPAPGAAPEPSVWATMILGVAGMGAMLRTRRRKQQA